MDRLDELIVINRRAGLQSPVGAQPIVPHSLNRLQIQIVNPYVGGIECELQPQLVLGEALSGLPCFGKQSQALLGHRHVLTHGARKEFDFFRLEALVLARERKRAQDSVTDNQRMAGVGEKARLLCQGRTRVVRLLQFLGNHCRPCLRHDAAE